MNWDGVPRTQPPGTAGVASGDWFHEMINRMPTLSSIMGGSSISNGVEITDMYSVIPSTTWPTHMSIYTGVFPGIHGFASMGGFIDRDTGDFEDWTAVGEDFIDAWDIFDEPQGDLDKWIENHGLTSRVFLVDLKNRGYHTTVAGQAFKLGYGDYIQSTYESWCKWDSVRCDKKMFEKSLVKLKDGLYTDLLLLYPWAFDGIGHHDGMAGQLTYADTNDQFFTDFWGSNDSEGVRGLGLERNTVFILFDDHGRITVNGDDSHYFDLTSDAYEAVFSPFEHHAIQSYATLEIGDEGVMAHIHLRDIGDSWTEHPPFNQVYQVGQQIWSYNNEKFQGEIRYVLLANHRDSSGPCTSNYCVLLSDGTTAEPENYFSTEPSELFASPATVAELLKGLKGPRTNSGNILIILNSVGNTSSYSPGFKFSGKNQLTVHGSISDYETNVPFAMFCPNPDSTIRNNIDLFLDSKIPRLHTNTRISIQLNNLFIESVVNSHEILMNNNNSP